MKNITQDIYYSIFEKLTFKVNPLNQFKNKSLREYISKNI